MSLGGRPLRFVGLVLATWIGARVAVLLPGPRDGATAPPPPTRRMPGTPGPAAERSDAATVSLAPRTMTSGATPATERLHAPAAALTFAFARPPLMPTGTTMPPGGRRPPPPAARIEMGGAGPVDVADAGGAASPSRWSGDGYVFLRSGGGRALGPGGQIGGGQAFARIAYRLDDAGRITAGARLSRAIGARQTEAALGLTVKPAARWPVRLTVERRVALDIGGRDAWATFAAGGIDDRAIGPLRLDGYVQTGVVGAHRTEAFVDGAARLGRGIGRLTLGGGIWGAAQPGVARLDLGPQVAVRLPLRPTSAVLALDWRIRVAGRARPGSGLSLTLAAGF